MIKKFYVFDRKTKQVVGRHLDWDDSWPIQKWATFNASTQYYLILDKSVKDINDALEVIQPANWSGEGSSSYAYIPQSGLNRLSVTGFTATPADGQVILNWNLVSDCTKLKYYVDGVEQSELAGSSTTVIKNGLTNGQNYTFKLIPFNAYDVWGFDAEVQATPNI